MKKILVPTDFSKTAQLALQVAANIARKAEAKIIILHVIEQPGSQSFSISGEISSSMDWDEKLFTKRLIEKSKAQLGKEVAELEAQGIKVKQELKLGNAYHGISTMIAEHDVDLVVMGTSGKSKLEEMIIGSNTEKVIRHAHCPVLTVHGKPQSGDFKNIVYATSMANDENEFSKLIKTTQEMFDSTVHIVRINTPNNFQPDTASEKVMQEFVKKIKLENYTLNIFNHNSEEEGIIHFAESIDADLIAMSTHGRKGFAHVLVGSIAEGVANHASRPVLISVTR
jgi:nucleotide-binding universal stress UspA family protein